MSDATLRSAENVLQIMGHLCPEDRRWLLDHLPPEAKSRLAELTIGRPRAGHATAILGATSAARIVESLHAEPAWLVHSVVFASDWPWRKKVLEKLPAVLRLEVDRLARAGARLAPAAGEFLLHALAQRIGAEADAGASTKSRFESLLRRFGAGDRWP